MVKSKQSAASHTLTDEVCYCARCGVSFLWTIEEKNQAQWPEADAAALRRPTHCPGCRRALPAAGRERGLVKWYNGRKRFGFIIRPTGDDLFAHGSELKGARSLRPGDLVEFSRQTTEKGEAAHEIVLLHHAENDAQ